MAFVDGRIVFSKLKGFPELCDNSKIQTQCFIDGAREVVSLIEEFGTLFSPVVYDMNGNIEKITKAYVENKEHNHYLEHLLLNELKKSQSPSIDSLLWLKRALELLQQFFRNVLNDTTMQESLKGHLYDAYCKTLKPYHGFFVQTAFSFVKIRNTRKEKRRNIVSITMYIDEARLTTMYIDEANQFIVNVVYRFIPNRSQLIGKQDENLKNLETFLNPLRLHLTQINAFYIEYNLDDQSKVNSI